MRRIYKRGFFYLLFSIQSFNLPLSAILISASSACQNKWNADETDLQTRIFFLESVTISDTRISVICVPKPKWNADETDLQTRIFLSVLLNPIF
jgi:hypothetical protein